MPYFVLVNKAGAPVNGDTVVASWFFDPAGTAGPTFRQFSRQDLGSIGRRFSVGIAWAISSTANVVTLDSTAVVVNGLFT